MEIAERLSGGVERGQPGRRVTVSVGVASSNFGAGDLRGLLAKADQRLYEAKRLGRDRVVGEAATA